MGKGYKSGSGYSGVIFKESERYPDCYYCTADGVTEWLNPPMVVGTEYRTVERFKNKPVYTKAVSFGALPDTDTKSVSSGLKSSYTVREFTFLMLEGNSEVGLLADSVAIVEGLLSENKTKIKCTTGQDLSFKTGIVFLKYIK